MSTLDVRKAALQTKIRGVPGGNRVLWSPKDLTRLEDIYMAAPDSVFRAAQAASPKFAASTALTSSMAGLIVNRDAQPDDMSFLGRPTCEAVDRSNDSVRGVDWTEFNNGNPVVLDSHNSASLPIATSGPPWKSGDGWLAVFRFPQRGVSAASDQVASAVRAKLVKGLSIGFIPDRWEPSRDPSRPFGINYLSVRVLEFSVCSIPCCPPCLILGPVAAKSATASASASASNVLPLSKPSDRDREARMAEAARLRRQAYRV
jgi:hypothetical protein